MNQPILLTRIAFNSLLANLLEVEERGQDLIAYYGSAFSQKTETLRRVLDIYIRRIDESLENIVVTETAANEFPYIILGSDVVIMNLTDQRLESYRIISPLAPEVAPGEVSFLAPLGKALLLKRVNERIVLETPQGDRVYKIISIKIATTAPRLV